MDDYQDMKKFIQAATEYSRHHADSSASDVQKYLQLIATTTNVNMFDPSSTIATHFYVTLHELMSGLDSRSMLVWSAISTLQKACTNKKAKEALIHTFKFIPVLSRFLSTSHISDKQLRLLQVLSQVTYGVKITWQEAHLQNLIDTLIQFVMGTNKDHKAQALVVLVNLCYKNLPVLYVLMRNVEIPPFIKCILKMNDHPSLRMHVCKMLMIIGEIKGQMPDADILNFVDVSFNCITDSFQRRDSATLRQMVDFFKDMNENHHIHQVMCRYTKTYEDVKRLLDLVESTESLTPDDNLDDCMAFLLDFIPTAFKMKVSKTCNLVPRLMSATMPWVHHENTCLPALNILLMVAELLAFKEIPKMDDGIQPFIQEGLNVLLKLLSDDESLASSEERKELLLSGILSLIAEISSCSSENEKQVVQAISCDLVKATFEKIYQQNNLENGKPNICVNNLSIPLLLLVSIVSVSRNDWRSLYMELLTNKQILTSMATAILKGDKSLKLQVFRMMKSAGKVAITLICDIMSDLSADSVNFEVACPKPASINMADCMPLYTSESRINELLASLREVNLAEANTSAVMELYEYKLASMGHAERRVQAALEAADARCIGLNHQVAIFRGEVGRLHQMLFYTQQTMEGFQAEKKSLIGQLEKISGQHSIEKTTHKQKIKELACQLQEMTKNYSKTAEEMEVRDAQLKEERSKSKEMVTALHSKNLECEDLNVKFKEALKTCEEMKKCNLLNEEALKKAQSVIQEFEAQVADFKAENEEIRRSLSQCMEKNSQKDEELNECFKKIQYLEQIREAVISVAAQKGKF